MEIADQLWKTAADLRGAIREGFAGLSDEELLEVMADFEEVSKMVSALQVRVAGELKVRSRRELGDEG